MSVVMRATDLVGRPVVTLGGADVAQVKDVVYAASSRQVIGFTLAGRGPLAGPMRRALPWAAVHAVGRDAVMVVDEDVLADRDEVAEHTEVRDRNTLGDTVMTDRGTALGTVTDVLIELGDRADVVGYEIRTGAALSPAGRQAFLPVTGTVAVSGEAIVVPAEVAAFAVDNLAEFGAALRSASKERDDASQ
jgi:uncharacterized protein YrrD